MQTRNKIVILLLGVTIIFGAMILAYVGDNDESLYRFRMLLAKNPRQLLTEMTHSLGRMNGLWYAGVSLFAVVMSGLAIRSLSGTEIRAFRDRLVALQVDRAELETSLQDAVWREKHARAAKDAAIKDLEERSSRFLAIERELSENEKLVRNQERELKMLRGRAATDRAGATSSDNLAQEKALRDELKEKTALLQTRDSALRQMEKKLTESVSALESQLALKESSLQERDKEIVAARAQLNTLTASNNEAQSMLQEQLKIAKETSSQKDKQLNELEKDLTAKLQSLDRQLLDREEALLGRTSENERLKGELEALQHRVTEMTSAHDHDRSLLQQELRKRTEVLQSKDAELKKLATSLGSRMEELENKLRERDTLLEDRTGKLNAIKAELTSMRSAKEQSDQSLVRQGDKALDALRAQMVVLQQAKDDAETALAEKLKKEKQQSQAKDVALKQLEKNLKDQIDSLTHQLGESQDSLQGHAFEVANLKAALAEKTSATDRAESLLQQELKRKTDLLRSRDLKLQKLEAELPTKVQLLEKQLTEKTAFLEKRDTELDALKSELGRMRSAKQTTEQTLRDELSQAKEAVNARDSKVRELEQSLLTSVTPLERQLSEQERLLKSRTDEITALSATIAELKAQLNEAALATTQAATDGSKDLITQSSFEQRNESMAKLQSLEGSLKEKDDLLKIHNEKITRLESELREKRTQLARYEITEWQGIERRAAWKHRLSKFGITLKD